ncbi:MAG: 4Fe-4S dicluster domain-containing protein [Holophagaceae bacterium]|nr:4Fe-4S dicluster domain-containing protein [Holophagaceae bacterium]
MTVGLLFDATRCIGCGACASACKEQNKLPGPVEDETSAYTWTTVQPKGDSYMRRLCMHCLVPTCASVCPVGALHKTPEGPVVYDAEKCMGCRYCMMACPFDVPKYQWDRAVPIIGKCIMCTSRVKKGEPTACAEACPASATIFGSRADLIREAKDRIRQNPSGYLDHIYGLTEAGGTSVMMLSNQPFEKLGLKTGLPSEPPAMRTWQVLSNIPDFVAVWGVFLYGVHWITARREVVSAHHPTQKTPGITDDSHTGRPS